MLIFECGGLQGDFYLQVHKFVANFREPAEKFLSSEELSHLAEMSNDKRRMEFLQSRFVLKNLLAKNLGISPEKIQFTKVGEGKPVLTVGAADLDFNLSHSGDCFAIAISRVGQVGVDIEQIRPPQHLAKIAGRFFSPAEIKIIEQMDDPSKKSEVFARFWSAKEALVKTVGGGVFKNVHEVIVDEVTWKIKSLPPEFGNLKNWQLAFFDAVPGYVCSLSLRKPIL